MRQARKRTRVRQKRGHSEEHRKAARVEVEHQMREWKRSTNEQREREGSLRVSLEELARVTKRARKAAEQEGINAHRGAINRALMAGSTPNINTSHAMVVDMVDTVPVLSGKRAGCQKSAHR